MRTKTVLTISAALFIAGVFFILFYMHKRIVQLEGHAASLDGALKASAERNEELQAELNIATESLASATVQQAEQPPIGFKVANGKVVRNPES